MPIIELDIGGTPRRVQVDDGYTPEDLDHIAKTLGGGGDAVTQETPTSKSFLRGAGEYIAGRAKGFMGAAERMFDPSQWTRPAGEQLSDVAEAVGPFVAGPIPTAVGLGLGAATAGAGYGKQEQAIADIGGNVLGGLGTGIVKAATRGAPSAAAELATTVKQGEGLQRAVPGMRGAVKAARRAVFDPIIDYAERHGMQLGQQGVGKLTQGLSDAAADFGGTATAAEKRVVQQLIDYPPQTMAELDNAMHILSEKAPRAFGARTALSNAMHDLTAGTPLEGKMTAAAQEWHHVIKPAQNIANAVGRAKTQGQAAQAALRMWNNVTPEVRAALDPTGDVAKLIEGIPSPGAVAGRGRQAIGAGIGAIAGAAGMGITPEQAYHKFMQGDVLGGFTALLGGAALGYVAGRSPGVVAREAARGVAGAVPPFIRGMQGEETQPTLPRPPEHQGTPERSAPAPQRAQREAFDIPDAEWNRLPLADRQAALRAQYGDIGKSRKETSNPPAAFQPSRTAVGSLIDWAANKVGIPPRLMRGVMSQESGGRHNIWSRPEPGQAQTPAYGLMQITPATFETVRADVEAITKQKASLFNPRDNVLAGAILYRQGLDKTGGSVAGAARNYFGPETPLGRRTQQYGRDIVGQYYRASP